MAFYLSGADLHRAGGLQDLPDSGLQMRWRRWMTEKFMEKWLAHRRITTPSSSRSSITPISVLPKISTY
ncbi:hypothetical protein M8494_00480 [Serratia ureilytica]